MLLYYQFLFDVNRVIFNKNYCKISEKGTYTMKNLLSIYIESNMFNQKH